VDGEHAAPAQAGAPGLNPATVQLDNAARQRQSDAQTAAGLQCSGSGALAVLPSGGNGSAPFLRGIEDMPSQRFRE
jgi:hypothetical protein